MLHLMHLDTDTISVALIFITKQTDSGSHTYRINTHREIKCFQRYSKIEDVPIVNYY